MTAIVIPRIEGVVVVAPPAKVRAAVGARHMIAATVLLDAHVASRAALGEEVLPSATALYT